MINIIITIKYYKGSEKMTIKQLNIMENIIKSNIIIDYEYNNYLYYKVYDINNNYVKNNRNNFNNILINRLNKEINNIKYIDIDFYKFENVKNMFNNDHLLSIKIYDKNYKKIFIIEIDLKNKKNYNDLKNKLFKYNEMFNIIETIY